MRAQSFYFFSVLVCYTLAIPVKDTEKKLKIRRKFIPKLNTSYCKGLSICNETLTPYPDKVIQRLVKRKKYTRLFSSGSLIEPAEQVPIPMFRDAAEEPDNICKTRRVTVLPKAAYDTTSKELRYIVNIQNFEQSLVYETCVEENKDCIEKEVVPFNFRTLCKQKYNVVRLVSLTGTGKLENGKFLVPSTCVCSRYRL